MTISLCDMITMGWLAEGDEIVKAFDPPSLPVCDPVEEDDVVKYVLLTGWNGDAFRDKRAEVEKLLDAEETEVQLCLIFGSNPYARLTVHAAAQCWAADNCVQHMAIPTTRTSDIMVLALGVMLKSLGHEVLVLHFKEEGGLASPIASMGLEVKVVEL